MATATATATATVSSAAKPGEFGFFPSDGVCCVVGWVKLLFLCFVSGLRVDGCAVGGCFAANASFISKSDGDSGREDLFFRSLAVWPATVDPFSSPLLHNLAADGWILRRHQALESLVKIGGGTNPYLHAGSGGGVGGSVVGFPAWRFHYRSRPDTGRRWLDGGDGFGAVGSVFRRSAHPHRGGWGGLDAEVEEDRWARAAWPTPAPKKRGVRPRLRATMSIRYRFHLKPLREGCFFGLGSVLAPSCSGDQLFDGLVKAAALPVSTGDLKDLLVFCCFSRILCVDWLQHLYPSCRLRTCLYSYVFMDVFLTV